MILCRADPAGRPPEVILERFHDHGDYRAIAHSKSAGWSL